jgi:exonuclease III
LLNSTSLIKPAALQQLACVINQFNIAVAIITETWFSSQHPDALLQIDGYQLYRRDRTGKKGGGVAIFVRNDINSNILSFSHEQGNTLVEVLWIRCNFLDMTYYIAGCYHPPKARYSDSVLTDLLSNQLDELISLPTKPANASATFVIAGDFNKFDTGFFRI